jgi:hypothetical protein
MPLSFFSHSIFTAERARKRKKWYKNAAQFFPPLRLTRVQLDSNQNKNWAKMENLSLEFSDSHESCACLWVDGWCCIGENEKSMSECTHVSCNALFYTITKWKNSENFLFLCVLWTRNALFVWFFLVRHDDLLAFVLSWLLAFFERENVKIEVFTAFLKVFHNFLLLYAGLWHSEKLLIFLWLQAG